MHQNFWGAANLEEIKFFYAYIKKRERYSGCNYSRKQIIESTTWLIRRKNT